MTISEIRRPVLSEREVAAGRTEPAFAPPDKATRRAKDESEETRGRWAEVRRSFNPFALTEQYSAIPLIVFSLITALGVLWVSAFVVVAPNLGSVIGVTNAALAGTLVNSINQGVRVTGPVLGYLTDRYHLRTTLLRLGAVLWLGGYALVGMSTSALTFVIAFGVGVLGTQLLLPAGTLLADAYPARVRANTPYFQERSVQVARVLGPLVGGALASVVGWQWMLILLGALGLLAVPLTLLVREPRQGATDDDELDDEEDEEQASVPAVPFATAWRMLLAIPSYRRYVLAVPWQALAVSIGASSVVFFATKFRLEPLQLGFVLSGAGVTGLLGLTVTAPLVQRLNRQSPSRMVALGGAALTVAAACMAAFLFVPWLWLALALFLTATSMLPLTTAAMGTVPLLVVPAQIRTMGTEVAQTFILLLLPWALFLPKLTGTLLGTIGFHVAPAEQAIVAMLPFVVVAAVLLAGVARHMDDDMRNVAANARALRDSTQSRAEGRNKMLICRGVDVHYGGAQVLFDVDFDVEEGEIVALLGTNGAGKSTLLRAISGIHPPSAGAIFLDGEDVTRMPPHEKAADGVVMMPGGHAVFPSLTVTENLRAAGWLNRADEDYLTERTAQVIGFFPILAERGDAIASNLSGGEQQMLALAQAFLMKPRLLMIDELSLGLAPNVVDSLLRIVTEIAAAGTTIVIVEQSVNVALSIARRAVFMEKGEVRYDGPARELLDQREILRSVFLGEARGSASVTGRRGARPFWEEAAEVLSVTDLAMHFGGVRALDGVSLSVRAGEVVGIVGPNGAGKTTLLDVVSGFVPADTGVVRLEGADVTKLGPTARARVGLSRSFQNVRLFPAMTVRENIAVAFERSIGSQSLVGAALRLPSYRNAERRVARRIDSLVDGLGLLAYADKFIGELSTGTRRIVDIACVLASAPKLLLLDEPTSGLAQAETEELGPFIGRIVQETGCGVIVVEHDLALVSSVSDRLVAMRLGAVMAEGTPSEVLDDPDVQRALIGEGDVVAARSNLRGPT